MQILVNQEPLSYALESENSLGEVVDGLASWLRDENFAITAIDVDDRSIPIHDRSAWAATALETVETLSIEAFPVDQVDQLTLAALAEYCLLLNAALENKDRDALFDLGNELPYVRVRLQELMPTVFRTGYAPLPSADIENGTLPDDAESIEMQSQLRGLITLIEVRLREYRNPVQELLLCLGQLASMQTDLEEVPVQLQTGNDGLAMTAIVRFAELVSRVIRILPLVPPDSDVDPAAVSEFAIDLTPVLEQLQEAFEARDTVLMGDLLEYEVAPRLAVLHRLVPDAQGTSDT